MSDSDDTDVLLMIPPDFFLADSDPNATDSPCPNSSPFPSPNSATVFHNTPMDRNQFNTAVELKQINEALANLELRSDHSDITSTKSIYGKHQDADVLLDNFSSFSSSAYMMMNNNQSSRGFHHSTPKNASIVTEKSSDSHSVHERPDTRILKEIDYYLNEHPTNDGKYVRFSENNVHAMAAETLKRHNDMLDAQRSRSYSQENTSVRNSVNNHCYDQNNEMIDRKQIQTVPKPLLSLCDIWGPDGQTETLTLHEERLRRQHCEKTIQSLQMQLLEYKQKISVAIKIDKSKDEAIGRLHSTNSSLSTKVHQLESSLFDIEQKFKDDKDRAQHENVKLKERNKILESELHDAIGLTKKLQERNECLEMKIGNLTMTTNEVRDIHRKQLEDLEARFVNSTAAEQRLIEEVTKLKGQNVLLHQDYERAVKLAQDYQKQNQGIENEVDSLRKQKATATTKLKEEKARADKLETQNKSLQQVADSVNDKEKNFLKELDTQRTSLKTYYQQQLEQVVEGKLNEFQRQIDTVEETLKAEAQQKELLIGERAMKQLQTLCDKNDEDIAMLNEKHNEEIELYRIQLANASGTIKQLQDKLNAYQTKRADIAERLHNVMETQWQRALEIITSPNAESVAQNDRLRPIDGTKLNPDRIDGVSIAERESLVTPTTSHSNHHPKMKSNFDNSDKLHAYVDFLLKKSPQELDQLSKLLNRPLELNENAMAKVQPPAKPKTNHNRKDPKRPWKY